MPKLVSISEGHEYQHNATKKIENRIYVARGNSKFAILFKQTSYALFPTALLLIKIAFDLFVTHRRSIYLLIYAYMITTCNNFLCELRRQCIKKAFMNFHLVSGC